MTTKRQIQSNKWKWFWLVYLGKIKLERNKHKEYTDYYKSFMYRTFENNKS